MTATELPSAPYVDVANDLQVGDVCKNVPLPDTTDPALYIADDLPGRYVIASTIVLALVVAISNGYAVVVPITTADNANDLAMFEAVVAADAPGWMSLPPLPDVWHEHAVALLFMPHTVPVSVLSDERLSAMNLPARAAVAKRFARAFPMDG